MDIKQSEKLPIDYLCPQCTLRKNVLVWRQNCEFKSGICEDCWEKLYIDIESKIRERLEENNLLFDNEKINNFRNKLEKLTVKD